MTGTELLVKVGSKYPDINDPRHFTGWRDSQIIDIRPIGFHRGLMERRHHAIIKLPNIDYGGIYGDKNFKSTKPRHFAFKKFLQTKDKLTKKKYVWETPFKLYYPSRERDWLCDITKLYNDGLITLSDYESIYNKSVVCNDISIPINNFVSILQHEDNYTRVSEEKDRSTGTVSAGTYDIGSGLDYSTVQAFISDWASSLTGDLTGEHADEETSMTSTTTMDTNTGSYTAKITAASGAQGDNTGYNGARINWSTYVYYRMAETSDGDLDNCVFEKLACDVSGLGNYGIVLVDGGDDGALVVDSCYFKGDGNTVNAVRVLFEASARIINNYIHSCGNGGIDGGIYLYTQYSTSGTVIYIANNTCCKNYNNFIQDSPLGSATKTLKNNIAQGDTGGSDYLDDGEGFGTTGTNISEDATSPDASYRSINLHDATSNFVDYANDDYHLDSGGSEITTLDDGEDLSGVFSHDADGDTRSTWYIGADEIATSDVSINHTASSATATPGTHALKVDQRISHTAGSAQATPGSHTISVDQRIAHTAASATVTPGAHSVAIDQRIIHSASSAQATPGSHALRVDANVIHSGASAQATPGSHALDVDQIISHTASSAEATPGTHAVTIDQGILHTASSAEATPGSHSLAVDAYVIHSASSAQATGGTHSLQVDVRIAHTAASATATPGTHSVSIGATINHTASSAQATPGTHALQVDAIIAHAAGSAEATAGSHSIQVDANVIHSGSTANATPGTHNIRVDAIISHSASSASVTPGTHTISVDARISHTGGTVQATPGTHLLQVDGVINHTGGSAIATPGSHSVQTGTTINHTASTSVATPGTHTIRVDAFILHSASSVEITTGTHTVSAETVVSTTRRQVMFKSEMGLVRGSNYSLYMLTDFDMRESVAVGVSDYDPTSGSFTDYPETWSSLRGDYYLYGMYNPSSTARTIKYKLNGMTTTFTAYIPAGELFLARSPIVEVPSSGTDNCTIEMCFHEEAVVRGTVAKIA